MTDPAIVRFTLAQKLRGLLAAGLAAWLLSLAAMYASAQFFELMERGFSSSLRISELNSAVGWTLSGAVSLGLSAAFTVVLAFGFPLMRHAERTGATGLRDAAIAGLVCGAFIGAAVVLLLVLIQRPDRAGVLLTPVEWTKAAADFLATLVIGAITGISARLAAGRPKLA